MTVSDRTRTSGAPLAPGPREGALRLYSPLIGITSLVILLQSLWAGMFIREGQTYDDGDAPTWVSVHDWGARLAFVLAVVAAIVAIRSLRARRDLLVGTVVLAAAILVESLIGGAVGDHQALTAVHIPLAMVIVSLCVWLPLRTRSAARI